MASATTIYDVKTRYMVEDKASKGFFSIGAAADSASRATGLLGKALAVVSVGLLARAGKKMFVDYNSSVEQSTISIAAQQKLLMGGRWTDNLKSAGELFTFYQTEAKRSVGTTQDFLGMHQQLAAAGLRSGMSMDQLKEAVTGATVASQILIDKGLGDQVGMMARDIKSMLAGTVNAKDLAAQTLISSLGKTQEQFNKMSAKQRTAMTLQALQDPAIKAAAKSMENSFAGVTSTLEDNIKITMGKVGLPLFKKITEEVKRWNDWIDKNPQKIEEFATKFANALVTGFNVVKDVASFIVEHKDLFMGLAAVWAGGKAGGAVLGNAGGKIGAIYVGALYAANLVDKRQEKEIRKGADVAYTLDRMKEIDALRGAGGFTGMMGGDPEAVRLKQAYDAMILKANDLSAVTTDGVIDLKKLEKGYYDQFFAMNAGMNTMDRVVKSNEQAQNALRLTGEAFDQVGLSILGVIDPMQNLMNIFNLAKMGYANRDKLGEVWGKVTAAVAKKDKEDAKRKVPGGQRSNTNVTIRKIEVVSDDPDRFAFGLVGALQNVAKNPVGAKRAIREG